MAADAESVEGWWVKETGAGRRVVVKEKHVSIEKTTAMQVL